MEYARADVLAVSSRYESFGLVTAEALAAGIPVVGFADCPGTNELVVDGVNGLLVSGDDRVAALEEGLRRITGDRDYRARLASSAASSVERFGLEAVADQWERVCRSMTSG